MNKRTALLIALAAVLATVYATCFTDWWKPKKIQIHWGLTRSGPPTIMFYLDKAYSLTSVKVVATEAARTEKYPHALWHIVAVSNSAPIKNFRYGERIRGMNPKVSTALPEPLDPDTTYSLLIEAPNNLKGQVTFQPP